MLSPKSNIPKPERKPQQGRTHTNAKFYTSAAYRRLRKQYLSKLSDYQVELIQTEATPEQILYLLDNVPICETCLRLFLADAYDTVTRGHELDHIQPINPDDALKDEGYGKPLDETNLQFLCTRHHAKKSQRERRKKK